MSDTAFFARPAIPFEGPERWQALGTRLRPAPRDEGRAVGSHPQDTAFPAAGDALMACANEDLTAYIRQLFPILMPVSRALATRKHSPEELASLMIAGTLRKWIRLRRRSAVTDPSNMRYALRLGLREALAESGWTEPPERNAEDVAFLKRFSRDCDTPGTAEGRFSRDLLDRMYSALPVRRRLVLRLLEMEGWTIPEVARRTGWPRWAVRWLAYSARCRFLRLLERSLGNQDEA